MNQTTERPRLTRMTLLFTVFFSGLAVMVIELVGSRVVAPYVGTSVYVWTSLIGIILGSLSLGYYIGGRLSDNNPNLKTLAFIIFFAGLFTSLIIYFRYLAVLFGIFGKTFDFWSVVFAPLLFVPSTFLFGMIPPYIIRLHLKNIETSGSNVGKIYALGTIGSILGTFMGGFFLISYFGNSNILIILGILTILLSFIIYSLEKKSVNFSVMVLLALSFSYISSFNPETMPIQGKLILDKDTPYKRIWIYDGIDSQSEKPTRIMTDSIFGSQSGMFLDNTDEYLFDYHKFFELANHFNPDGKKSLMIGAGAFTFQSKYLNDNPDKTIDVVEIDPELKEISEKYFGLTDNPRLGIIHQDGRIFLNQTEEIYDTIFIDAFTSLLSIPYQLTTKEALQNVYNRLTKEGVVLTNIISGIEGHRGEFFRAEYSTYKSVFPTVLTFKVHKEIDDKNVQNLVIVGLKTKNYNLQNKNEKLKNLLANIYEKEIPLDIPVLLDEFSPVERYTAKMMF